MYPQLFERHNANVKLRFPSLAGFDEGRCGNEYTNNRAWRFQSVCLIVAMETDRFDKNVAVDLLALRQWRFS